MIDDFIDNDDNSDDEDTICAIKLDPKKQRKQCAVKTPFSDLIKDQ